jgi:hypothetical protein
MRLNGFDLDTFSCECGAHVLCITDDLCAMHWAIACMCVNMNTYSFLCKSAERHNTQLGFSFQESCGVTKQ